MLTPRAIRTGSFEHAYGQGKSDVRESVISKFSRSETGSESGNEGGFDPEERSANASYDELATPDVWATPKEEGFSGSGFFHPQEQRSRDNMKSYA